MLSAQLLRVHLMAFHDSLYQFTVFIINHSIFLQKPVGMQAITAMNDYARRAFQSMQKGEQFLQRLRKILFLMCCPLDIILSMDK